MMKDTYNLFGNLIELRSILFLRNPSSGNKISNEHRTYTPRAHRTAIFSHANSKEDLSV